MSYYQSLSPKTEWHFYNALYIRELLQLVITDEILALKKEPRAVHYIFTCIHEFLKTEGIESYLKNVTDSNGNIVTTILDCSGRFWSFNSSLGLKSVIQEYGMDTFLLFQTKPHEPKKINFMNNIDIKQKLKNIQINRKKLDIKGIKIISFSKINNKKIEIENFLTILPEKFKHAKWFEQAGIIPETCCYSKFSEQDVKETHVFIKNINDIKKYDIAEHKTKIKDKSYETLEKSLTYNVSDNQKPNHSFLIKYSSIFNTFKFNQEHHDYNGNANNFYYILDVYLRDENEEKEWLTLFSESIKNKHVFTLIPLKSDLIMEAIIPCFDKLIEQLLKRNHIANTSTNNFNITILKNFNKQYEIYEKLLNFVSENNHKNRF